MTFRQWLDLECQWTLKITQIDTAKTFNYRFPLFSKGVDTYRYEYGVFLLNKDIEMV